MEHPPDQSRAREVDPSRVYRVFELNSEVHAILEKSYPHIRVEGEISNFRAYSSGHWYFTLKDDQAQVAAVMFRGSNRRLRFLPEDGMHVLMEAQVSLYEPRGSFQLIVQSLEPRGTGALNAAFEALKRRLQAEGLFQQDRKRPLPLFPRRIAVVTSPDGAALRDILRVLGRRQAGLSVLLVPSRVQGEGAGREIAAAIRTASRLDDVDALIVGRGGGSLEDLWAWNEEEVARAIAASPLPVISAVGHEIDVTIADFVADLRAPTPSAAAEIVARSHREVCEQVDSMVRRLVSALRLGLSRRRSGTTASFLPRAARMIDARLRQASQRTDELAGRLAQAARRHLQDRRRHLDFLAGRLSPRSLEATLKTRRQRLSSLGGSLLTSARWRLADLRRGLTATLNRLEALSPLAVLERGYSLARLQPAGILLRDARQATPGMSVELVLHKGRLDLRVLEREEQDGLFPGSGQGGWK